MVCEALFALSFHHGFGKHDYSIRKPDQFVEIMKWAWIAQGFGQVTSVLARISITISLVNLFGVHRWFKWFLIVLTAVQTCLGVVMLVLSYAQVRPIEGLWNVFLPPTEVWRLDTNVFIYTGYLTQSLYTFADVSYVLIPVAIVWRLKLALHRRLGLIALLAAMLATAVMSILKTWTIHWQGDPTVTDPLYRNSLQVLFANMEQTNVIIMGCVPSLRAMFTIDLPPGLSRLGQSINSLLGRTTNLSKGTAASWGNHPTDKVHSSSRGTTAGGGSYHDLDDGLDYHPSARWGRGGHHDLEMAAAKLGGGHHAAASTPSVTVAYTGTGTTTTTTAGNNTSPLRPHRVARDSTEELVGANYVRRTDQFSVSYHARDGSQ